MFHIHCISIHELLYLFSFLLPFALHFCLLVFPRLLVCMFSLFVFNYYIWPICCNFTVCRYPLIPQHCHIFMLTYWFGGVCVCTICLLFQCPALYELNDVDVHQLYHVSLSIHSLPKWGILKFGGQ
jgi:hypothetical protein